MFSNTCCLYFTGTVYIHKHIISLSLSDLLIISALCLYSSSVVYWVTHLWSFWRAVETTARLSTAYMQTSERRALLPHWKRDLCECFNVGGIGHWEQGVHSSQTSLDGVKNLQKCTALVGPPFPCSPEDPPFFYYLLFFISFFSFFLLFFPKLSLYLLKCLIFFEGDWWSFLPFLYISISFSLSAMARMNRPAPVEITYKNMRFLITHNPTNATLNKFIEVSLFKRCILQICWMTVFGWGCPITP